MNRTELRVRGRNQNPGKGPGKEIVAHWVGFLSGRGLSYTKASVSSMFGAVGFFG